MQLSPAALDSAIALLDGNRVATDEGRFAKR
jgi:hypothetical protein